MRIFLLSIFFIFNLTSAQVDYFNKYQSLADSLEKEYSIPSSVMLAVAYHESAGGQSRNAKLLNNHFGITGSNNLKHTHNITSRYKQYDNVTESYIGFCQLVSRRSFYDNLKGSIDYSKWVNAIAKSGYSSNSTKWATKINWIIKNYSLK
jgi:flagellum-specific peptidoglycan hydrolase FlgJ